VRHGGIVGAGLVGMLLVAGCSGDPAPDWGVGDPRLGTECSRSSIAVTGAATVGEPELVAWGLLEVADDGRLEGPMVLPRDGLGHISGDAENLRPFEPLLEAVVEEAALVGELPGGSRLSDMIRWEALRSRTGDERGARFVETWTGTPFWVEFTVRCGEEELSGTAFDFAFESMGRTPCEAVESGDPEVEEIAVRACEGDLAGLLDRAPAVRAAG
jgi:hypothetical protein